MTIHYQIEYTTTQEEYDILDVDFLGEIELYDHSFDDEFGYVEFEPSPYLGEVQWEKTDFSDEQNEIIEKYVTENFASIEAEFIKKYNKNK